MPTRGTQSQNVAVIVNDASTIRNDRTSAPDPPNEVTGATMSVMPRACHGLKKSPSMPGVTWER